MAHSIARLVRYAAAAARFSSRNNECTFLARYASSAKPGSTETNADADGDADAKPTLPEVGYSQKPRPPPAPKSPKSPPSKSPAAAAAAVPGEESLTSVGYAKAAPKPPKANAPAGSPSPSLSNAGYAKKPNVPVSAPAPASGAAAAAAVAATNENTPNPGGEVEALPEVSYTKPADTGHIEEVTYAPRYRIMPLPEDRAGEVVEVEVPGDGTSPPKRVLRRVFASLQEHDYNIPLPRLVKPESIKKREPVTLAEAIHIVKTTAHAKFDETVEAHIRLGVDPKRSDQIVRGAVTLPHGTGKAVKIAVFAEGPAAEEARAAGADVVGAEDLVDMVLNSGGKLDFEKCIATPALMPKLGKIARILGPRGLMPNPKVGTVTSNVGDAVRAAKQGRVDFKADKTAIIHAGLGKVSFSEEALLDNIAAFAGAVLAAKPAGLKKSSRYVGFFNKFHLASTMGPGIPVTIQSVGAASDQFMKTHQALAQ